MEPGTLTVNSADKRPYPVVIGPGLLSGALPAFITERDFSQVLIVTNDRVGPLYGDSLQQRIPSSHLITLPDGERYKTLDTVRTIYDHLLDIGADRSSLLLALGGGVIGDMAGFAASTFMRGLPFIQVPTTVLAMVDASIGGKVGVDLPQGKNLVGAFYDPLAVFADPHTLSTLDDRQYRSGLAEIVKAGLIDQGGLLSHLERHGPSPIEQVITDAIQIKIDIVQQDRLEGGIRAYLNLGHTFAHAIEQVSLYRWPHGEAVAVGLVGAALLSVELGLCDPALARRIESLLTTLNLPIRCPDLPPDALWAAMQHDKKWRDGRSRFVLLAEVGHPLIRKDIPPEQVIMVLEKLQA